MIRTGGLRLRHAGAPELAFPDLDLPQGGLLLLQGVSGSGKSSWLSLVAGLRLPSAGALLVAGQDLAALSPAGRDAWRGRHVGLLPQRLHLSDALDVRGNLALAFHALGRRVDEAAIRSALASLGVDALAARRPGQLSVGQAQRVALARAVLMTPAVLLADEPTASLDDEAAAAALAALAQARERCDATLVVATHDRRVREAWPQARVLALARPAEPAA
ncbi:ATP-binding cassette domain-containing protein [Ramlibacter rhizophilus]|uniref:ATP-binding cassette domain-containing protein n=1 Tax=Ramlibacter rhizophilus TaxID=1781167 RepID=A0A4Z0BBM9_9BURK|nr:ATP-binding cassette domain-containing protein [Ramlibacter rhizophilus]TFY96556.1 ATP-binding cassette domain-containing protein [Ramlibacter rhizophilus]